GAVPRSTPRPRGARWFPPVAPPGTAPRSLASRKPGGAWFLLGVASLKAKSFAGAEPRRPPRRVERGQQRQGQRHDDHRGSLARIHFRRQPGQEVKLGRKQLGIGEPRQELAN